MMIYRSRTDIVAQILQSANETDGVTKTKIMYRAFLSYAQLKQYLVIVLENHMLEHRKDTQTYKTTTKGLMFLKVYEQMDGYVPAKLKEPHRKI